MFRSYRSVVVFLMFFAVVSRADFSGDWEGIGEAIDNQGWKSDCERIQLNLRQTSRKLVRLPGDTKCGHLYIEEKYSEAEIRGTELWVQDTPVGTITENEITIDVREGPFLYFYKIERVETDLKYRLVISGGDGYLDILGRLSRVQNN